MTTQLGKDDTAEIRRLFDSGVVGPVRILLFVSKENSSLETRRLLEEVASLSGRVKLEVLVIEDNAKLAREMKIEHTPTTLIPAVNGAALYYLGTPGGYELRNLVEDIIDVSRGQVEMDEGTRRAIGAVKSETVVKVFVTLFCRYSPLVVRSSHRFALENPHIRPMMIDTAAFPELAERYSVVGVPTTIINNVVRFDGAPSERVFAEKVLEGSVANGRA